MNEILNNQTKMISIDQQIMQSSDMDTVERLMVLRREIEASEARRSYQRDFARLQSVLPSVQKSGKASFQTKKGGRLEYCYVKIDDLTNALKPFLNEHGFSFLFKQKENYDKIAVACIVMHIEGHRESVEMSAPIDTSGYKNHLQAMASTVSYLRRLTFTSAFGLSVTDEVKAPPSKKYYSESAFRTNFPVWRLKISHGEKTPQQVLQLLRSKGVMLTPDQEQQVLQCGV